jgi:hypothetical protein
MHSTGDVIIKVVGVVPSMPAFLAGHMLYSACFLRGCDVRLDLQSHIRYHINIAQLNSMQHFVQLLPHKKLLMLTALLYSSFVWFMLFPHFDGVLRPVLGLYIVALLTQFQIAMFSEAQLIPLGKKLGLMVMLTCLTHPGY